MFGATLPRQLPNDAGGHSAVSQVFRETTQRQLAGMRAPRLPRVEKDADDPPSPSSSGRIRRQESSTGSTLSRLFAVQAATSPENSRHPSFTKPADDQQPEDVDQLPRSETTSLPNHLYTQGLLAGKHSDIVVHAFGNPHRLHRLILDRAPFFARALSGPWLEASENDMTIHPEEDDESITENSFHLAIKRLYGCFDTSGEDEDPIGCFATACWLGMQDWVEESTDLILKQMEVETLAPLIRWVTSNYYGRAGDRLLISAKSMLARDGWRMPIHLWDDIPGHVVQAVVSSDAFYAHGEWDRWVLAKRLLKRRLKAHAASATLLKPENRHEILEPPKTLNLLLVRCDATSRHDIAQASTTDMQKWISFYTNPDVEPILLLLDEGIHYEHLSFEQLQLIRNTKDCLGVAIVPEKVINNALWRCMELRQLVMHAKNDSVRLGFAMDQTEKSIPRGSDGGIQTGHTSSSMRTFPAAGKVANENTEYANRANQNNEGPRKYYIPLSDRHIVMGGNADSFVAASATTSSHQASTAAKPQPSGGDEPSELPEVNSFSYALFAPLRFSVEFPNPQLLKNKKRVYSRTVSYAGSLWNVYVRKMCSTRSQSLGVYLHRVEEHEPEKVIVSSEVTTHSSVNERIQQLQRELEQTRERLRGGHGSAAAGNATSASGSGERVRDSYTSAEEISARASTLRSLMHRGQSTTGQVSGVFTTDDTPVDTEDAYETASASEDDGGLEAGSTKTTARPPARGSTLPPYTDERPTIMAYFKIYSPSRGGRMLSVYESAPDTFELSQSWGWKSSALMIDEGFRTSDQQETSLRDEAPDAADGGAARSMRKDQGDGKLRFMVVLGVI